MEVDNSWENSVKMQEFAATFDDTRGDKPSHVFTRIPGDTKRWQEDRKRKASLRWGGVLAPDWSKNNIQNDNL